MPPHQFDILMWGHVAELVYAYASEAYAARLESSNLSVPTMRNTDKAFKWIIELLNKEGIPFEIDGGLAAKFYGSDRELADIDINITKKGFNKLLPLVQEYTTFGPARYKDNNWDLTLMSLKYAGQNIDISPLGEIKYFDKEDGVWLDFPNEFDDVRIMDYLGMKIPVVNEIKLMIYKKQLGRGVDKKDYKSMLNKLITQWFGKKYE